MQLPSASGPSLLVIEAGVSLLAVTIALFWPGIATTPFSQTERFLGRLARNRWRSVLVVGAAALLLRLAILPLSPVPHPFVHDEFANLLGADTFASGRLTNSTHPMWIYFESFHITQRPTYMSMYFPAQALVLAAGEALMGHPWFGVWLSAGLMCAAICWMLQGWLPPGWALLGGMLAVIRLALFSYWGDSYYGGAVAALGGALVLGALPRIRQTARTRDWIVLVLGAAILANNRPYEGLLLCAPVICVLVWWAVRTPHISGACFCRRALLPVALLLVVIGADGYYNYKVFGNALTLPYQINRATYASAPVFIWQTPRPEPVYRYKVMRDFYSTLELGAFLHARTFRGFVRGVAKRASIGVFFFFGFILLPPLIMLKRVVRDRRVRFLLIAGVIYGSGICLNAWIFPHYLAPFTCAAYAILLQSMRHLRVWRPGRQPRGLALVRILPVACLALAGLRLVAGPMQIAIPRWPTMWYGTEALGLPRARVGTELESRPGLQLAIVRYSVNHSPLDEWVYDAADIDSAKVVWAREAETGGEAGLLRYFRGRTVWLVEPDTNPPRISAYPGR